MVGQLASRWIVVVLVTRLSLLLSTVLLQCHYTTGIPTTKYPPDHSSYTTITPHNTVFFGTTTEQPTSSSSSNANSDFQFFFFSSSSPSTSSSVSVSSYFAAFVPSSASVLI